MSSTTTVPPAPHGLPSQGGTSQTHQTSGESHEVLSDIISRSQTRSSPSKPRSLSDVPKPSLSPSPAFRERAQAVKDDTAFISPRTPKRPNFPVRGLSLQMPPRDVVSPTSSFATRVPLSPKLDSSNTYGAPAPMLPRRSRGLDFARACTNLHHSTLAESSPDSSPTISGRGLQIPQRKSLGSNSVLDSPSNITSGMWSTIPHSERTMPSSSVSSINMLDSDKSSTASSDDEPMDRDMEDPMLTTPHVSKLSNNFISGAVNSPGADWMSRQFSPAAASLMSFQRARMRKGRSTQSSSSGNSSKPSPAPLSPPLMKSIEHPNGNFFQPGLTRQQVQSRRESLSLGTGDLHLSSDSGEEDAKTSDGKDASGNTTNASSTQSPRGVIRRPVTRRSNLLPKTKTFARIRAALLEEAAPVENEAKREADVIHQVRESDPTMNSPTRQSTFRHDGLETALDDDMATNDAPSITDSLTNTFSQHAEKNSDGLRFWNNFDRRHRTPPPSLLPRKSSSAMSDDVSMDSTMTSQGTNSGIGIFTGQLQCDSRSRSRSSTPLASIAPTAGEAARKANNRKRGRDDDLDPSSFKRRAVSPGMSVQSSPVLQQSPGFNGDKAWGQMPPPKTGTERSNSGSNGGSGGGGGGGGGPNKRVGLQGMVETNDGLMNMSIE
ncbi:hypothetical protein GJ744_009044 [Endocarpon pusillum]|uniref:Uncharacterized protein n=1 Tax=Endocarpon pusillum TaxID=364733 RepID=A0A8H7AIQ0_9EURO|nr:hypothetical protein GJ744_009044 [Endocarpon pusillum]